jgi:hypothetical protein
MSQGRKFQQEKETWGLVLVLLPIRKLLSFLDTSFLAFNIRNLNYIASPTHLASNTINYVTLTK